jgi:hypothetical protein
VHHRQRASRFEVQLDAWYRTAGETRWHHGVTRNVSQKGALIAGDEPTPSHPIVLVIGLPSAGCLVGRGRILPAAVARASAVPPTFAIAVERYRIQRRDAALHAAADLLQRWYAR